MIFGCQRASEFETSAAGAFPAKMDISLKGVDKGVGSKCAIRHQRREFSEKMGVVVRDVVTRVLPNSHCPQATVFG